MTASASEILREILFGCGHTILNLLRILIPLMIVIELLTVYKIMEKMARALSWVTTLLGMTPLAILPLIVATIMGVTYGTGTLIEMNKRDPLPRKDFLLIAIFFFICHGIIETTMIWGSVGANVLFISAGRLLFAVIITMIAARLPFLWEQKKRTNKGEGKTSENAK